MAQEKWQDCGSLHLVHRGAVNLTYMTSTGLARSEGLCSVLATECHYQPGPSVVGTLGRLHPGHKAELEWCGKDRDTELSG